jgi:tetratricopeptide (TPR) repeat protein
MVAGAGLLLASLWMWASPPAARAVPQEKPAYTRAEYDAYNVAANEKNLQQRIQLLDDFMSKYPGSTLLPYVYQAYYTTYNELKSYPRTIEYADRLLTFGDKLDVATRFQALYLRTLAFNFSFNDKDPNAREQATKAREAALQGLKVLGELKKPEGVTDEQFAQNKKGPEALFNYTAGFASLNLKEYSAATDSFKAALAINPNDPVTFFRLGVTYLQMDPPQHMDGFWALARSVGLKGPGEPQVRAYLRNRLASYQQTACDKLIDSQMNELISLAASSPERPATYKIPGAAELQKAREETTNFIADLKGGGEKAKLVWLATCGLEFPEVVGKVLEVNTNDSVVLKLFTGATPEETEAGTTPNMEVKVEGQPEAKRIQVGDPARFSATLTGYDPDPFMLHWEKGKVNPEDIPEEKAPPGKRPTKRPTKRPPKKPA